MLIHYLIANIKLYYCIAKNNLYTVFKKIGKNIMITRNLGFNTHITEYIIHTPVSVFRFLLTLLLYFKTCHFLLLLLISNLFNNYTETMI